MTEEIKNEILQKLNEIEQKLTEYFYVSQEEKKRINIERIEMEIPEHIKTLAIPHSWVDYKFYTFSNAPFKHMLKISSLHKPGDSWLYLNMWLHGEVLFNDEKEIDIGTAKIERICNDDYEDYSVHGKYLTFERIEGNEWQLTKNAAEAYVYRLVLKNYVDWCWNDTGKIEISNAFDYKVICIEPLRELRLYMILPTRETTKISIERRSEYDDFVVSWNNGDPYIVKEIKNNED